MIKLALSALTAALVSQSAIAVQVEWQSDRAMAFGNGCNSSAGDTFFVENGGDLSVVFSNLRIDLSAGSGPLSETKNCRFQVPFKLEPHFFPQSFVQQLTFGIVKTRSTKASIRYDSSIFFSPLPALAKNFANGISQNVPLDMLERDDGQNIRNASLMKLCARQAPADDVYSGNISMTGTRASLSEDLLLATDSLDVRLDVEGQYVACNSPTIPAPTVSLTVYDPYASTVWPPIPGATVTAETGQTKSIQFRQNQQMTLVWSSGNASNCTVTSSTPRGPFPLFGASQANPPHPFAAYKTTVTATCFGSQGRQASASVVVNTP